MNGEGMVALDGETLRSVDLFLEGFYPRSRETGKQLDEVRLDKSQIRGFESLAGSTRRFSEIVNYIKNQAGKERGARARWRQVAGPMLGQLEELEAEADRLASGDAARALEIKLKLARGWVRQVVAHYLYERSLREEA